MAVSWIHTLFSFSVPRTGTIAEPSNIPFDGTLSSNDRKGHQRGSLILVSTTVGGGDSIGIVIPTGTDRQSEIVDSTLMSDVARRVGCVDWDAIFIGFIGQKKMLKCF